MKTIINTFCAAVLMSVLCVGCSESKQEFELGLGEEIPGMEIQKATGTMIGSYFNGFCSGLVQVDEEYPIGKTIEYADGTHQNMIQVQSTLPIKLRSKISFSFREYNKEKDIELFQRSVVGNMLSAPPNVPIYTITEYEILDN